MSLSIEFCLRTKPIEDSNTSSNVIVGAGLAAVSNKRKMKAFVYGLKQNGEYTEHFLWICDNHEKSIFTSKNHTLAIGHFFEGIFEETPTELFKWTCAKYIKPIDALMQGSILGSRPQLIVSVERYEPGDGTTNRPPQVYSKYLGMMIDNKEKLPKDCVGCQIYTQMLKVGDDYKWVVTRLL